MPRTSKFDDMYEKVEYFTKLFIYCEPSWNNLHPIVEIIRNIKPSYISYRYGKGQHVIKTYGSQYNHNVIGCEIKNYDEFIKNILKGYVKFVFIFGDSPDTFSRNLINFSKKHNIVTINYSNIDSVYHFYSDSKESPIKFKTPGDVVNAMCQMTDYISFKQVVEVFPEFNLIPEIESNNQPVLEKCLKILKESHDSENVKKDSKKIQVLNDKIYFDPNLYKLRKFNKELNKKNESLRIEKEENDKNKLVDSKCTIANFFKKKS
jgi:hypothetical protein